VPNPAKKPAYQQVEKATRTLHSAETARDRELLAASTPPPGTTTVLTNQILDTINAGVHTADAELDAAIAAHRATPARLPLCQFAAIAQLCQALNTTDTVYPGTTLTLRYSVKPHRPRYGWFAVC
jgi:hypothetical protein